ncbi:MAG: glycoside hydrolase family 3 C-terminal domain-containing protein [Lachnospiraceae bacterium]|nr:glycoside hydrolase family 3 C-terminal domain-containing protein [Lachnospiraceae bacterium]
MNYNLEDYASLARAAAAEGIVLIKNDNGVLPLKGRHKVALFGRTQFNYYKSGTGSGGLVNTRYVTGIYEAILQDENIELNREVRDTYEEWIKDHPFDVGNGWAQEPWYQEEMELDEAMVERAAVTSDTAIIIVGRTAGEDKDSKIEAGSYLLTDTETDMIAKVCKAFDRTIVLLNTGSIIDMHWVDKYAPDSVLYIWQGGQEGGIACMDVVTGRVAPSGRLCDTIAEDIADCYSTRNYGGKEKNIYAEDIYVGYRYFETFAPDKAQYPFAYGLSYTKFSRSAGELETVGGEYTLDVTVTNIGDYPSKDTVTLFVEAPQGRLGKPSRSLCGFAKTKVLEPGESETVKLCFNEYTIASYDDSGVTGHKSAYVLEAGIYNYYVGGNVREASLAASAEIKELKVIEELREAMAPVEAFSRLKPGALNGGVYEETLEDTPLATIDPLDRRAGRDLPEIPFTGNKGISLKSVKEGRNTLDEFIAQLSDDELMSLVRGEGMSPSGVTPGIAGAFGGVSEAHKAYGIPKAGCSDGPSGIRMDCGTKAFAMPSGTCLACSFNEELSERLYEMEGLELRKNHIDTLLGPGMNIHRNPLNGRNFEYFSEDPLLTGKMAAAQLVGMHKSEVTGTIKHFACNNQEYMRSSVDTVISERALREIYLKGYEIAVKEAGAFSIMTSYNRINGIHAASNIDLLTTILREEWGFDGIVMTDWWAMGNEAGKKGVLAHTAVMVRAQNDLYMVMPDAGLPTAQDTSAEGLAEGLVTRAEFQRSARNILKTLMRLPAYRFFYNEKTDLDRELDAFEDPYDDDAGVTHDAVRIAEDMIELRDVETEKGITNNYIIEEASGLYELLIECCVEGVSDLAQVPVSVFRDHALIQTVTLTGKDTEYRVVKVDNIYSNSATMFIKLYFGQGGMKIKSLRLHRLLDSKQMLERIRKFKEEGTAF